MVATAVTPVSQNADGSCNIAVQGWIRGRELQVNNLVHFAGVGVYQLHSAQVLADPCPAGHPPRASAAAGGGMAATVAAPTQLYATAAETLVQSLPYDPMNAEQSHFSEAELAAADAARRRHQVAGGGRGRKDDHMSAWLMDEDGQMLSDYEDEEEDEEENEDSEEEDEEEDEDSADDMDGSDDDDDGEVVDSSAADDAAAAAEWRRVRQAATEDRDYPDEVDVPIDVSARQRFARFRGLKSLRTSPWDPKEQLPPDYSRIFKLANAQQSAAVAKRRAEADCFE